MNNLTSFLSNLIKCSFIQKMIQKSKLSIAIHEAEFSKDFQYMISVQFGNQKKQTDVSALVRNPIFANNSMIFELTSNLTLQGSVIFVAHMLLDELQPGYAREIGKQNTKILGECSLDLSPFALQPSETYNLPIRQQMKFIRSKDGKQMTVGRFIASIKIVKEDSLPQYTQELQNRKIEKNEYFADLPDFDPSMSFDWRVRVQIRQAMNIPSTDGATPQVIVEVGWSEYRDTMPQQKRIYSSTILNNNNPEWNQTILIANPSHMKEARGYIMILMKDSHNLQDIFKIYIPIQSMGKFIPYNIRLFKEKEESVTPTEFYFSALLEAPINGRDKLYDVIISDITFQPMVVPFKQINLATVFSTENEPQLKFYSFNPKEDSIERILQFDQAEEFNYILSQTMRIPTIKSTKQYRAATVITISEALLKKKLSFYLIGKIDKASYKVAGLAEGVQKDLINLLIQKTKKKLFLPVRNHPSVKFGNCQIEISQAPDLNELASSRASQNRGEETASERLMKQLGSTSNESMLKHVTQNNEIIARILRQLDDKSESLRQAAAEISDLRGRVKLLQNQNSILRQQALREEDELINLVQREVENMGVRELKEKIVKLSQLYKLERVKSRELDKTIKLMEPQISNSMQLNSIIVSQKNSLQTLQERLDKLTKDYERIGVYKQTIKKQEKVIIKLEKVMKDGMEEVRNARAVKLQLEQLKKGRQSGSSYNKYRGSNSSQRQQIERLQGIIAQLQTNNTRGSSSLAKGSSYNNNGQGTNYELEFKLHQAETRIASLQEEIQQKARSYARELAMLRMRLAEKEAVMDGYMR